MTHTKMNNVLSSKLEAVSSRLAMQSMQTLDVQR